METQILLKIMKFFLGKSFKWVILATKKSKTTSSQKKKKKSKTTRWVSLLSGLDRI